MVNERSANGRWTVTELPAGTGQAAPDTLESAAKDSPASARLLEILTLVADSVRAGEYTNNQRDGVLADTVIGSIRCLLLVHEPSPLTQLSPREQEIARMVASGRTNQAIADALAISIWTVSTHLRRIFAKLAVGSRAEMVAHLIGPGELVPPTSQYH